MYRLPANQVRILYPENQSVLPRRQLLESIIPKQPSETFTTIVSGSIAAITATYAKQPISRVKFLKQVSDSATKVDSISLYRLYADMIKSEGLFLGLFRGSSSACFRNIPHAMMTFTFYPKYRRVLNDIFGTNYMNNAISGSLASMSAHIISHPLDTIRVRIAVQYEMIEYPTIQSTFCSIYFKEGANGFYHGLPITLLGSIFRAGIGFGLYESFKSKEMREWNKKHYPIIGRLSIAYVSGIVATIISYPFDTIRRKQQVFGRCRDVHLIQNIGGNLQKYNTIDAVKFIVRNQGIRGLYKGILLAMIKTPLAASISLTTNDYVKQKMGWDC
eukprot:363479_1